MITLLKYLITLLKDLFINWDVYNTATGRKDFWFTQLAEVGFYIIWVIVVVIPISLSQGRFITSKEEMLLDFIVFLPALVAFLPNIALMFRRLNDTGYSRWAMIIVLVPFGNLSIFLFMAFRKDHYLTNFKKQ